MVWGLMSRVRLVMESSAGRGCFQVRRHRVPLVTDSVGESVTLMSGRIE